MAVSKPNFVIFMLDQLAPQFMPTYGNKVVQMPALSALAEAAVVFDSAYCNYPLHGLADRHSAVTRHQFLSWNSDRVFP